MSPIFQATLMFQNLPFSFPRFFLIDLIVDVRFLAFTIIHQIGVKATSKCVQNVTNKKVFWYTSTSKKIILHNLFQNSTFF